jgi:NADH-ubiquinone oxidoreductase chain 3
MFLSSLILILVLLLVLFLTAVKILLMDSYTTSFTREEASPYECGFEQHSLSRIPVSIRYFLLTLVFLIFDIEIMLLMFTPYDILVGVSKSAVILVSIFFLGVLFLGLIFE